MKLICMSERVKYDVWHLTWKDVNDTLEDALWDTIVQEVHPHPNFVKYTVYLPTHERVKEVLDLSRIYMSHLRKSEG